MIVFCSTSYRDVGTYQRGQNDVSGFHFAVPPTLAETTQWEIPGDHIAGVENAAGPEFGSGDIYSVQTFTDTPAPLGRYTGAAAIFYADGHTDTQTPGALYDQSLWIMGAEQVGDTPARFFTHSDN